jgi:hypothetical protein
LGVTRRTCTRWIKEGLKPIDIDTKPLLIMGEELKKFLKERQQRGKRTLNYNEYYCMKCREPRVALGGTERVIYTGKTVGKKKMKQQMKVGQCILCKSKMNRLIKVY